MSKTATLIAALALLFSAPPALADGPYHLDAGGKCRDSKGWVKQDFCVKHDAPNCKKGKPCGHACIAQNKVCHLPS